MDVRPGELMRTIWPAATDVTWTVDRGIDDEEFVRVVTKGRHLRTTLPRVRLEDWKSGDGAAPQPGGRFDDRIAHCLRQARRVLPRRARSASNAGGGDFYWFVTSCECGISYLFRADADGTHCVDDGSAVATGLEGYHFHRDRRCPGTRALGVQGRSPLPQRVGWG